jgi:WXXGXW repeat (2 copies)
MNPPVKTKIILIPILLSLGLLFANATVSAAQAQQNDPNYDPAAANMAPVPGDPTAQVAQPYPDQQQQAPPPSSTVQNESIQSARQAQQQGAPPPDQQDQQQMDQQQQVDNQQTYDNNGQPLSPQEQVAVDELNADQPPPQLPAYDQPPAPEPDYLWTPGYWGYAPVGYYWVPGVWVAAPWPGALWTPGYWAFYGGRYRYHHGYWGRYVGFYGGINYGFGYPGYGFWGGYWSGPHFFYNRAVTRVNVTRVTNVYTHNVYLNRNYVTSSRIAYNGGPTGIRVQPRPAEIAARTQPRLAPMQSQLAIRQQAQQNQQQFYNTNRGRPATIAVQQPIPADRGVHNPIAHPTPAASGYTASPRYNTQPGYTRPAQPRPGTYQQQQPGNYQQQRPSEYQSHPAQPGPIVRPVEPQQPGQTLQYGRPAYPNQPNIQPKPLQPNVQPVPQYRPEYQSRPAPTNPSPQLIQPRPEQQYHPAPQYQPHPQPESHPANQPHPQGGNSDHNSHH